MQSSPAYPIFVRMNGVNASLAAFFLTILASGPAVADRLPDLDGIWFTCEFTQSKTPPTDGCEMFDDEGFEARDGQISYLRMLGSQETGCKGQKKGQCFPASLPQINREHETDWCGTAERWPVACHLVWLHPGLHAYPRNRLCQHKARWQRLFLDP